MTRFNHIAILLILLGGMPAMALTQSAKDCPLPPAYEYITGHALKNSSKANTVDSKIIEPANAITFRYLLSWDCPDSQDEEYGMWLKWSIPDSLTTFNLVFHPADSLPENISWIQTNGVLRTVRPAYYDGYIRGTKNGDHWEVTGSLQIMTQSRVVRGSALPLSFTGNFTEWDQVFRAGKKKYKMPKTAF
jgi:hypothetical protein